MNVLLRVTNSHKAREFHVSLEQATEMLVGSLPTEQVILMRHLILDGEDFSYEYGHVTVAVTSHYLKLVE